MIAAKYNAVITELSNKFDAPILAVNEKFNASLQSMSQKIDQSVEVLNKNRIDIVNQELNSEIEEIKMRTVEASKKMKIWKCNVWRK